MYLPGAPLILWATSLELAANKKDFLSLFALMKVNVPARAAHQAQAYKSGSGSAHKNEKENYLESLASELGFLLSFAFKL